MTGPYHLHLHPLPPLPPPSPYIPQHTRWCSSSYHYPAHPGNQYLHLHCECENQGQQGLWDWLLPSARPGNGGFRAWKDLKGSKGVKGPQPGPLPQPHCRLQAGLDPSQAYSEENLITYFGLWPDQSFRKSILFKVWYLSLSERAAEGIPNLTIWRIQCLSQTQVTWTSYRSCKTWSRIFKTKRKVTHYAS